MRMSAAELRQLIAEEVSLHNMPDYVPASQWGTRLMKEFVRLLGDAMGYTFVPLFHDSVDGVTWPVVEKDGDKHAFEHEDSMFVMDPSGIWLELDHLDLDRALGRYASSVHNRGMNRDVARRLLWDDIRFAAIG